MARAQQISVLGATGSIGRSTLDVIGRHPGRYQAFALSAHRDVEGLIALARTYRPRHAVIADPALEGALRQGLAGSDVIAMAGPAALAEVAAHPEVDTVVAGIVGAAGLGSSLAAARAGKRLCLANKEALVMGGRLFMEAVTEGGCELLPVDSEHNALFQCMPPGYRAGQGPLGVRRLLLTASGGPFRRTDPARLAEVTPEQACAHPNWSMGRKISVDSATMMNKGLEVIEARWLFDLPGDRIQVVIHPQSVIHSLVSYVDGSVLAQLGRPDMRTPIACALAWPQRSEAGVAELDLFEIARLDFEAPDAQRFPCLGLAFAALEAGSGAPVALNAANEVAVAAFLARRIAYNAIAALIEDVLTQLADQACDDWEAIHACDAEARQLAAAWVTRASSRLRGSSA